MEIKLTVEDGNSSAKFWIDEISGNLVVETAEDVMEIPNKTANELIQVLRGKLFEYEEKNRKYFWQK